MSNTPRSPRRVFLVEDDAWIRTFLRDVLLEEGYLVSEAADGRTALRMVRERLPDVMLLDLAMPDVTGHDVLHELKRNRRTRHLPVLVISAYTRVLTPDEADSVYGVLSKPLVVANLLEQIRRALGESG
jgi:CheY-like chemotaxis protein